MSKLNAGAFEFVPGRPFAPHQPGAGQPPPPAPIERAPQTETPAPPPTITLNIGGSKPSTTNASAPAPAPSVPTSSTVIPAVSAASTPAQSHQASKSASPAPPAHNKVFSTAKSKTDTSSISREVQAVADQEVLKDLFGDSEFCQHSFFEENAHPIQSRNI